MKSVLLLLCSLVLASPAFAIVEKLDLDSAVHKADLVARIKVISAAPAPKGSGYAMVATVSVTASANGPATGAFVGLLSDNGLVCPNVRYSPGDDCIVLATRRRDGNYETMSAYGGQFRIKDGTVPYYAFHRYSNIRLSVHGTDAEIAKEFARTAPAGEMLADLRRRLRVRK